MGQPGPQVPAILFFILMGLGFGGVFGKVRGHPYEKTKKRKNGKTEKPLAPSRTPFPFTSHQAAAAAGISLVLALVLGLLTRGFGALVF